MSVESELHEFLMHELAETYDDFEDDSFFAFSVFCNIAIAGNSISESMIAMYVAPVIQVVDEEIIYNSMAYFHGSSILSIECDCSEYNPNCIVRWCEENEFYAVGVEDRLNAAPNYNFATSQIMNLRDIITQE